MTLGRDGPGREMGRNGMKLTLPKPDLTPAGLLHDPVTDSVTQPVWLVWS